MEELFKHALENGNPISWLILAYLIAREVGPYLKRRWQGRNGSSSLRGQIDKIEILSQATHDAVLVQGNSIARAEQDIQTIFERCDKRHIG